MEENQLYNTTPNIDTTSFTLPVNEPVRIPEQQGAMQFGTPNAQVANYTPAIMGMVNSVRFDALNSTSKSNTDSTLNKMFPDQNKLDLTTTVPLNQTHELLNDGETWLPRYESYVPGIDNEARIAAQQSNFEKFINPVKRFISNTAKAPLDIASFVYGVGDAAISGRFDALYDNSFSKYVDDLTTKTNFEYKNYYDKKQSDLGFNLYTWDKFGSGAEFTARMLASEAIIAAATGGTSVPASMARWGLKGALYADRAMDAANIVRTGNKLSRMLRIATEPEMVVAAQGRNVASTYARMTGALETAANRGAWGDRLVQLRFATTSPMYEAGFEAMHFRKEAEQDFWNYYDEMGKKPTTEEINAFSNKMNGAANWVFGLNMGILSVSNLAMFGDLLQVKNPLAKLGTSEAIKSNIFRIGTEAGENGLKQAMKAGFWNKTAAYMSPFVKGALIEGVYEEGSQGIASNTLKNYVGSSYNKDLMQKTGDYASAFSKAFNDQFSTKEGIEEVAIGALVGGLFGGVGGAINTNRQYRQQKNIAELQNRGQEFVNEFRTNTYTNEQLLSLFSHANRFQDIQDKMDRANLDGNKFEQARLSAESFTSLLNAYSTVGKEAEFINMWSSMMTGLDNQSIAESTGLPIEEIDNFKTEQIQNMKDFSDNYSKGREAAQHMFKPNIGGFTEIEENGVKTKVNQQNLVDAFSYAYGMSFFNEKYATETFTAFQNKLGEVTSNKELVEKFGALGALQMADRVAVAKYKDYTDQYNDLLKEYETLADQINSLNNRTEEKENVAQQVVEKAKQLEAVQNKISELTNNKQLLWKSIIDNFYQKMGKTGFASELDLNNFTDQVTGIQDSLNTSTIDKADKLVLNQLLDQFSQANDAYRSYSNLVNRLADPKYTYKTYRSIFGSTRAKKDKSLNEHTRDVLLDIYSNLEDYNNTLSNDISLQEQLIIEEDQTIPVNTEDPLNDESELTIIDSNKAKIISKQKELQDISLGNYSDELQSKINDLLQNRLNEEDQMEFISNEVERLNKEIEQLEKEIEQLEVSNQLDSERLKNVRESREYNYKQYEYTKRNGEVVIGWIEIRNKKTFFVNKKESIYLGEERSTVISSIENIKPIEEEQVIVENNEVYVNGKLYKISNFDTNVSRDSNNNYEITLKTGNNKDITISGNIADSIIYQYKLNKFLEQATNEQLEELNRQTEQDIRLEEKYEELISKTEDRDSKQNEINISSTDIITEPRDIQSEINAIQEKRLQELNENEEPIIPLSENNNYGEDLTQEQQDRLYEWRQKTKEINDRYESELNELNYLNDNTEIDSEINDIITDYQIKLQDELNELQGIESLKERKSALLDEINELNRKVNSSETIDPIDIALLNKLELKLDALNKEEIPFDPNDTYFNQLTWIINNIPKLNFENVETLAGISSPNAEDVTEYLDLIQNEGSKTRIAELREDLLPYNLADGFILDGINILDLINLYNQSKKINDINNQQEELPESEFQKITKDVKDVESSSTYKSPNVGLNYDGAYIEQKQKNQNISHIKLVSMLEKALDKGLEPEIIIYNKSGNQIESISVTTDNVEELGETYDNVRNIKVVLSEDVYIRKPQNSTSFIVFGDILPLMDLSAYAITGQPTSYNVIYDQNLDGTLSAKESEFNVSIDGNIIPFDRDAVNSIKNGDAVTLEFDRNDDYNKTLSEDQYVNEGNIYIKKNGKLLNILKASNVENKSTSEGWANLEATRRKVIEASKQNKTVDIKINNSYIGLPIINLNQDGTAMEVPLDEKKVVGYGYIDESGNLQGDIANIKMDNIQYLEPLMNYGYKTPVMAFEAYGKVFGFPMNIKPQSANVTVELDAIMDNPILNKEQRMFAINTLLESYGMLTNDLALSNVNYDVDKVRDALASISKKIDITDKTELINAEKTAYIDLNNPFMSAKLVLDLISSESEINSVIQTSITDANQNPNVEITTVNGKGKNASENNKC